MRFLLGCILGLAALMPFAILSARTLSVPTPPTKVVVASADTGEEGVARNFGTARSMLRHTEKPSTRR